MRKAKAGNGGYTIIELLMVIALIGLLMAASVTAMRYTRQSIVAQSTQMAVFRIGATAPDNLYPLALTTVNLVNYGAPAEVEGYSILGYTRTGTPAGRGFVFVLLFSDGETAFCITNTAVTRGVCS